MEKFRKSTIVFLAILLILIGKWGYKEFFKDNNKSTLVEGLSYAAAAKTVNVTKIALNKTALSIVNGNTATLTVTVTPSNATNKTITWTSSNTKIATVDKNGKITAKGVGTVNITAKSNNGKSATCKVTVTKKVIYADIILKIGQNTTINPETYGVTAAKAKIKYTSSNTKAATVDKNGKVLAKAEGTGNITIKVDGSNKQVVVPFRVNKKTGIINDASSVWGYTINREKTPLRADINFFKKLVKSGKGSLSGNIYTYKTSNYTYKYDIKNSVLTSTQSKNTKNTRKILMRMYYPDNTDLSKVNTFTFFGGTGEQNFKGYFSVLDKNRSDMKTSGIVILVSATGQYYAEDGIRATDFIKNIVGQKKGVLNAVGGFSMGGPASGVAAYAGKYDRLVICNSSFNAGDKNAINYLKDKEILMFAPTNDNTTGANTRTTLNYLANNNYTNVTVITNNSTILNTSKYVNKFLIINPGSVKDTEMYGHRYVNITKAKIFSYACR